MWIGPSSMANDLELERAWEVVNRLADDRGVAHSAMHRLTGCCGDVLTSAQMLREAFALHRMWVVAHLEQSGALRDDERTRWWREQSHRVIEDGRRLAVSCKAFYFFVRSFHDAAYVVMLHAQRQRTTDRTSFVDGTRNPESYFRRVLEHEVPGFVAWFYEIRDLRNALKVGRTTASGGSSSADGVGAHLTIHIARDEPREVDTEREIGIEDVERAVSFCARFMEFVAQVVTTGALPKPPHAAGVTPSENSS